MEPSAVVSNNNNEASNVASEIPNQLTELSSGISSDKSADTEPATSINLGGDSNQMLPQQPPPPTMQQQQFNLPQVSQQLPQLQQQQNILPNIQPNNVQFNPQFYSTDPNVSYSVNDPTTTTTTDTTNNNDLQVALPDELIDVYNHLGLIGRLLASGSLATIKVLQVCRNLGENIADAFGITKPKYEYEINQYNQMKQEEEEKQQKLNQMYATWQPPQVPGNEPIVNAAASCSGNSAPTTIPATMMNPVNNTAALNMENQVQFSPPLPPQASQFQQVPQYLPPQMPTQFEHHSQGQPNPQVVPMAPQPQQ